MIFIKNISGEKKQLHLHEFGVDGALNITETRASWAGNDDVLIAIASSEFEIQNADGVVGGISSQIDFLKGGLPKDVVINGVAYDSENSFLVRPKTTSPGWMQQYRCMEFETSAWNSLISLNPFTNDQIPDCWIKFYDVNGQQITEESGVPAATMTVLEWEAAWDYDIAGSLLFIDREVTENVRAWAIAVPDLPAEYGGSKVNICGGLNLKFIKPGTPLRFDGRTPKRLFRDPTFHTNKLKIIVRHSAGFRVGVMVVFDTYKE
jgi:hypothetical protein